MILNLIPLKVPSRSILADLVSRGGLPEDDIYSVCPYNGQEAEVRKQIKQRAFDILPLFEDIKDFSAEKARAVKGSTSVKNKTDDPEERAIILEDIHEDYVKSYLTWVLIGLKLNKKNSLRELERDNKDTRTWSDSEDELVTEADLLTFNDSRSLSEELELIEKIPYLLKRLHAQSKIIRISIISFMIASAKTRETAHGTLKPGKVLEQKVYKMSASGYLGSPISKNEGNYSELFVWAQNSSETDPIKKSYLELMNICEYLEIDLRNEDPKKFDESLFQNMSITYIPQNDNYVKTELNREVLKILSQVRIDDYSVENWSKPQEEIELKEETSLLQIVEKKKYMIQSNPLFYRHSYNEGALSSLLNIYNISMGTDWKVTDFSAYENVLKVKGDDKPFLLDVTDIFYNREVMSQVAFIHASGFLVIVNVEESLYYLTWHMAEQYFMDWFTDRIKPGQAYEQFKFGMWRTVM